MQIYVDSIIHRKNFSLVTGYLCFELRICEIFVFFQYLLLHATHVDAAPTLLPTLPFCPPFTFFLSLPMSSFPSFSLAFRPSYAPPFLNMLYFIVSDRRSNVFQVLVESRFLNFISRYSSETNNRYGNKRSIKQRFGDNYFSISLRRKF